MIDEKDINNEANAEAAVAAAENASGLDKWLHGLSPGQLAAVQATVNTVAEQRQETGYGAMSNNELRKDVSKRFGYSPKV